MLFHCYFSSVQVWFAPGHCRLHPVPGRSTGVSPISRSGTASLGVPDMDAVERHALSSRFPSYWATPCTASPSKGWSDGGTYSRLAQQPQAFTL
ncbi:TPA: transcriptional regulator [Pseudomonas aeruginosa]|uniref:Transcriptional regulator n=1 Tax=Pseudomonas aeruginosa TaxID=287 RepID=A0ABD7K0Z0_PSEAI|nr:transcriptional regulator [Pseudomonas aeruginosa]OPD67346.1 transcriptional regulator [Pseudomonas paraeruginosa]OPE06927.1 transcriptional regulator [Pseudomonas aeruginosa]OPE34944.1 transcriptional regulator [Pseudomonas aeruginosa]RPV16716.1 transcriptional regulator [Pseudomonas aeruginosa]